MISSVLNFIKASFNKKASQNDESQYYSLTPSENEDIGEYEVALKEALSNNQICNIAITGPYGSGKSTVIKSFEKKYRDLHNFNFLNISLAAFNFEEYSQDSDSEEKIKQNAAIEKSLLQQMIFKVPANKLQDSNLNRLKPNKYITICGLSIPVSNFITSVIFLLWLFVCAYLVNPEHVFFKDNIFIFESKKWIYEAIAALTSLGLLQYSINAFPKLRLSKLGFASAEISFNEKNGDSILNKHLDEIIYFYSITNYNIVVFEDLDRLPNKNIFVTLREINTLLNNSSEIKMKNKKIKFIFALGDDIFKEDIDRTKFFDFIIPIIPIINASNSASPLLKRIQEADPKAKIPDDFIAGVTLFIDDMRLLLNIVNEYVIYKKKLSEKTNTLTFDDNKLLGMIVYKNKHPHDFKQLNYKRGYLFNLFKRKQNLIQKIIRSLEDDVTDLSDKKVKLASELLNSKEELRRVYLSEVINNLNLQQNFNFDRSSYSFEELIEEDIFEKLVKETTVQIQQTNRYAESKRVDFDAVQNKLSSTLGYTERKSLIEEKSAGEIENINSKLINKNNEIRRIKNLKLYDLIKKYPNEDYFPEPTEPNSNIDRNLIRFLVTNRHIAEDYEMYISYFHEGQQTANDKQFLIRATLGEPTEYSYTLNNPENVLKEVIRLGALNDRCIFNLDLYEHVLTNADDNYTTKTAVETVINSGALGHNFSYKILTNTIFGNRFITEADKINSNYWELLLKSSEFNEEQRIDLFINLLESIEIQTLTNGDSIDFITSYLSENSNSFKIMESLSIEKAKIILSSIKVKFRDLSQFTSRELLESIHINDSYEISAPNIRVMLRKNYVLEESSIVPNYTSINESEKKHLKNYINKNLVTYVKSTLLHIKENIENEERIIELLNNNKLSDEQKEEIIDTCSFTIESLESIQSKVLWKYLLSRSKVHANWINVNMFYSEFKETDIEVLISFLNTNAQKLSVETIDTKDELAKKVCKEIIYMDELSDDAYNLLIKPISLWYSDLSDLNVSQEKISHLLNSNMFQVTEENFSFLKSNLPSRAYELIEKHPDIYLKNEKRFGLNSYDFKKLIASNKIDVPTKIKMINIIPTTHYSQENDLAKVVCTFVVEQTTEEVLDVELMEIMFGLKIGFDIKIALFNRYSTHFDIATIKELMAKIEKVKPTITRGRPTIPSSPETKQFAEFLKNKNLINYKEEKGKLRLFPTLLLYS